MCTPPPAGLRSVLCLSVALALCGASAAAACVQKTWNGSVSTAWGTAANWTPSGVPGPDDTVVFSSSSAGNCLMGASRTVGSLTITSGYSGATLDLQTYTLTLNRSLTVANSQNVLDAQATGCVVDLAGTGKLSNPNWYNQFCKVKAGASGNTTTLTGSVRSRLAEFGAGTVAVGGYTFYTGDASQNNDQVITAAAGAVVTTTSGDIAVTSGAGNTVTIQGFNGSGANIGMHGSGTIRLAAHGLSAKRLDMPSNATFEAMGFGVTVTTQLNVGWSTTHATFRCGAGTVTVGDFYLEGSGGSTLDLGSSTFNCAGPFNVDNATHTIVPGASTVVFGGASGTHTIRLFGESLGSVEFPGNGAAYRLSGAFACAGDLTVRPGSVFADLAGSSLTVGGSASFTGASGSLLNLAPASQWTIAVNGALTADYAHIGWSRATTTTGRATERCVDAGNNVNWTFGPTYGDWAHSRTLLVNTTTSGAGVAEPVEDFPVCLRLTLAALDFSQAKTDGADLRFSTMGGVPLDYEIEQWDSAAGSATVWVRMDVPGNAVTGVVMYWGNPNGSAESNPQAVFGQSNAFAGVWHLSESPADGVYGHLDATASGNNAKPLNFGDSWLGRTGKRALLGRGDLLDSSNDWLVAEDDEALDPLSDLTVSAWVRVRDAAAMADGGVLMMHRNDESGGAPWCSYLLQIEPDMTPSFRWGGANGTTYGAGANEALAEDAWCHVVATRQGGTLRLYLNGQDRTWWSQSPCGQMLNANWELRIGAENGQTGYRKLNGYLDELRVCGIARSPAWIRLCYENQKPDQTLVGLDNPRITLQPVSVEVSEDEPCTLRVTAIGPPEPTYQWYRGFDETIQGATGPSLTIASPGPSAEMAYYCTVTNASGALTSEHARVTVVPYDQSIENPLPDADNDDYPAVVEAIFGTSDTDPNSAPVNVAKVDSWNNNPGIRKRVVYDFSHLQGYATRSGIGIDILPGTLASEHVPVIQALVAPPAGIPDPDLTLPEGATTFGSKVFAVTSELEAGRHLDVPIPYPDQGWLPQRSIVARRYNESSGQWERVAVSSTAGGAMRVTISHSSTAHLTFAQDKYHIHFVGRWAGAYAPPASQYAGTNLATALTTVAQNNSDTDPSNDVSEVWVTPHPVSPAGYKPGSTRDMSFVLPANVKILGGFPDNGGDWYARNSEAAANKTILTGDMGIAGDRSDNAYHVVTGANGATLDGFEISGGNADGANWRQSIGGGLFSEGVVNLTVSNCVFTNNNAVSGGAMAMLGLDSSNRTERCRFIGNAAAGSGGAMYLDLAEYPYYNSPHVKFCRFTGNSAQIGGALSVTRSYDGDGPLIERCVFWDNDAVQGGAIEVWDGGVQVRLKHLTVSANTAWYQGGGVYVWHNADVLLDHCCVVGNEQNQSGTPAGNDVHVGAPEPDVDQSYVATQYNAFSTQPTVSSGGGIGTGFIIVATDPGFVDPGNPDPVAADFRLLAGDVHPVTLQYTSDPPDLLKVVATSLCLDAGEDASVPGAKMDIGAYETVRVMPLGNSNTAYTYYREALRTRLLNTLFVGIEPYFFSPPSLPERYLVKYVRGHIGISGQTNSQLVPYFQEYTGTDAVPGLGILPTDFHGRPPHAVLIMAGTNDLRLLESGDPNAPDPEGATARAAIRAAINALKALVETVRSAYQDASILVASPTPFRPGPASFISADATDHDYDLAYAYETPITDGSDYLGVRGLVQSLRAGGDNHVHFVDISRGLSVCTAPGEPVCRTPNDGLLSDPVHMNEAGGRVAAETFYRAIATQDPLDPDVLGWSWAW